MIRMPDFIQIYIFSKRKNSMARTIHISNCSSKSYSLLNDDVWNKEREKAERICFYSNRESAHLVAGKIYFVVLNN